MQHRSLAEASSSLGPTVRERGPLLRLDAQRTGADRRWALDLGAAAAALDYDGRDQAGGALATTSSHREVEAQARWRVASDAVWGEAWAGIAALHARRAIHATPRSVALTETSTLLLPVVRWHSVAVGTAAGAWHLEAQWRASVLHRLRVDYSGVFDPSSQRAGTRHELGLRLALDAGDGWTGSVGWTATRQGASGSVGLTRDGAPAGTARQPRVRIDDLGIRIGRRW